MRCSRPIHFIWVASLLLAAGCATSPANTEPGSQLDRRVMFTVSDSLGEPRLVNGYVSESYQQKTRKDGLRLVVNRIVAFHRLKKISQWSIKALGLEAIVAEVRGDQSVEDAVNALTEDARIESVEPVVAFDLLSYNDPYFHLQNASTAGADIERIHDLATGKNVSVALVDTGVDRHHPELADRIIYSRNFVDDDQDEFDNDEHGTSVAGIIASTANNDLGIVGIAPESRLMIFKSCWQDSQTRVAKCDSYSIMKALVAVLEQQPDILNLSLAGPDDPLIRRLLKQVDARGIIVVAAVDSSRSQTFPASMEEVIAVSAPLFAGSKLPKDSVLAPGTDILTTTPGATYAFKSGSSMATAYVSGVAALMKERQPALSSRQLRLQLMTSAQTSINMVPVVDICHAVSGSDGICPVPTMVVANKPAPTCETCGATY